MPEGEDAMSRKRGVVPASMQVAYQAAEYIIGLLEPFPIRGWTYEVKHGPYLIPSERAQMWGHRPVLIRAHTRESRFNFLCEVEWRPPDEWKVMGIELRNRELYPDPKKGFDEFCKSIDILRKESRKAIFHRVSGVEGTNRAVEVLAQLSSGSFYSTGLARSWDGRLEYSTLNVESFSAVGPIYDFVVLFEWDFGWSTLRPIIHEVQIVQTKA